MSKNGDEYYTPEKSVEMIIPHLKLKGFKTIWCPFDTSESNFVKILKKEFNVIHSHIFTGEDFFECSLSPPPHCDCIVSNPPFSKRTEIFQSFYEFKIPFALIMNMNGLFDSKKRFEMFKNNQVELLIPKGRMKFIHNYATLNAPNFQSVYVCSKVLNKQIVFSDYEF